MNAHVSFAALWYVFIHLFILGTSLDYGRFSYHNNRALNAIF